MNDLQLRTTLGTHSRDLKRLRGRAEEDEAAIAGKADAVHGHVAADVVVDDTGWGTNLPTGGTLITVQDTFDYIDTMALGGGGGADIVQVRQAVSLRF